MFFQIDRKDEGKVLRIESLSNSDYSGFIYTIYEGDKDSIWALFLRRHLPGVFIAVFTLTLSVVIIIVCLIFQYIYNRKLNIIYLALGVLVASVWLLVESKLRQLVLPNSFVSTATGFYMTMLLPFPFAAYMNRIQKRRHQMAYMIVNSAVVMNFIYATIMQLSGSKDFFQTMGISHIILIAMMVFMVLTIVLDIKNRFIKEYSEVAVGLLVMVIAGTIEIYLVYQKGTGYNGVSLALGLVFLLFTAVLRAARDLLETEKQKQKAITASEAKTKFLANMSHEIRTPINTVIGMNEMILRENKDENIAEYARNINSASKMLISLINDVLDFAKIESGKIEIVNNKYYTSSMFNDIILGTQVRAEKKRLNMVLEIDEHIPAALYGDEFRIKQILNNLLSNAIKYTETGSIILKVTALKDDIFPDEAFHDEANADIEMCKLVVSVCDTGIGIKKEDMDKLFDSFKRLELSKNRYIEGTGLGLSITKQLVEQMDGSIEVDSEYGKGSCFTVTIPQRIMEIAEMGNLKAAYKKLSKVTQDETQPLHAPDAKVLVVDDNKMNLTVIRGLLKRSEIKLDFANSGTECLELCQQKKYDLILMDHMMPEPDGIETLHMLRDDKENPNTDTIVIVLTANAIDGVEEDYINEGFADYIAKPIEVSKLEKTLRKYL